MRWPGWDPGPQKAAAARHRGAVADCVPQRATKSHGSWGPKSSGFLCRAASRPRPRRVATNRRYPEAPRSRAGALPSQASASSSPRSVESADASATRTAASRLPQCTSLHTPGWSETAVRMPGSSSITFMCCSSHRVAKILPATRNDGRPWWSCSTASGSPMASRRASSTSIMAVGLSSREVHFSELTAPEQRVLGCLIEKRWTTPEQYPLSLNALRLACNQSTNRDPVTHYDEHTVREAAQRLSKYGLTRLASGHSSRAIKYRHLAEEALGLNREELAVLAVLLLRGPQTPGELKLRTERMAKLDTLEALDRVLATLIERRYARRLGRRPGQKEDRFEQLLA